MRRTLFILIVLSIIIGQLFLVTGLQAFSGTGNSTSSGETDALLLPPTARPSLTPSLTPATNTPVPQPGPKPTDTPIPATATPLPPTAVIAQKVINVRSGPGVIYNAIGVARQDERYLVTGQFPPGDWLRIDAPIGRPAREHPKRPIEGLACPRSEVSGRRLWGLFRERFERPEKFFARHLVLNYCPLVFMEASARNRTPDKLPATEREALRTICDRHLEEVLTAIRPRWLIGIGAFAEKCAIRIAPTGIEVGRILHPSPASPAANRGWAETATRQLVELGIWETRP